MSEWRASYAENPNGQGTKHLERERPTPREAHKALKRICNDIIFVRDGDQYHCFGDDAKIVAKICGLPRKYSAIVFPAEEIDRHRIAVFEAGHNVATVEEI